MLLKNATVLNGDFHRVKGDLLMRGDTIAQIGEKLKRPANRNWIVPESCWFPA